MGAIAGPLSELMYLKDYWRPNTLFGQSRPSLEDAIFGIVFIGITLIIYPLVFKRREWQRHHKKHTLLSILYLSLTVFITILLLTFGVNSGIATSIVCLLFLFPLFYVRKGIIKPAILTGLMMVLIAIPVYLILFGIFFRSTANSIWIFNTDFGIHLFKYTPITELMWFFTVGCFIEALDIFAFEIHYRRFAKQPIKSK